MEYIYIDETEFEFLGDIYLGAGALIVNEPISADIITRALENLKNDPDIYPLNSQNKATLDNAYFHASFDSKDAHSHIMVEINKHIKGEFHYTYFKKASFDLSHEDIWNRSSFLSSLQMFNSINPWTVTVENRNSLNVTHLMARSIRGMVWAFHEQPVFKTYFPPIEYVTDTKGNPGLQIADFLLWVCIVGINYPTNTKAVWLERLQTDFRNTNNTPSDGMYFGSMSINNGFDNRIGESVYNLSGNLPALPPNLQDLLNLYADMESFVCNCDRAASYIPPYLLGELDELHRLKAAETSGANHSARIPDIVAKAYVMLFDNSGLFDQLAIEDLRVKLSARVLGSLMTRTDRINGVRTSDFIKMHRKP